MNRIISGILCLLVGATACAPDPYTDGEALYKVNCANCHADDGAGLRGLIPPLRDSDFLKKHWTELPCIIRNGQKGPLEVNGKLYEGEMPPNDKLSEVDVVNICNYLQSRWHRDQPLLKLNEVKVRLSNCKK